ncbi:MAG: hypothetical protein RLZZ186_215 [Cyanobacteriota bacterium]|jgi:hypothetical protein
MGPDLGLAILLPALLFSAATVLLSARQEQEIEQRQQAQASNCSSPIWPPAKRR